MMHLYSKQTLKPGTVVFSSGVFPQSCESVSVWCVCVSCATCVLPALKDAAAVSKQGAF